MTSTVGAWYPPSAGVGGFLLDGQLFTNPPFNVTTMSTQHPITPPPELVDQWRAAASNVPATLGTDPGGRRDYIDFFATRAAQWGADQELEACCLLLDDGEHAASYGCHDGSSIRAARRSKPPSLKDQGLKALGRRMGTSHAVLIDRARYDAILAALEALPDDN
jgi:hypothetical protein